ncbi:TIGR02808 family protein [Psychromonas ossibalaenae]|nr:TIGR02808 family protein [Psychromonas ossibalaenae]
MSELESIIWHTLGYLAMPTIFAAGFIGVFLVAVAILKVSGDTPVED